MAQDLQNLLDKIKQEGVDKAAAESNAIINKAEKKAAEIIALAKSDAEQIIKNARLEGENLKKRSESAIKQSSRDIILTLKSELEERLDKVLIKGASSALTPEFMAAVIKELAESFIKNPEAKITVSSSVKDCTALTDALRSALTDSFKEKAEVFPDKELKSGFKVNFNGGDVFYDFSGDAIVELLADYAGPVIGELLKK